MFTTPSLSRSEREAILHMAGLTTPVEFMHLPLGKEQGCEETKILYIIFVFNPFFLNFSNIVGFFCCCITITNPRRSQIIRACVACQLVAVRIATEDQHLPTVWVTCLPVVGIYYIIEICQGRAYDIFFIDME